jgi:hypothetical protein
MLTPGRRELGKDRAGTISRITLAFGGYRFQPSYQPFLPVGIRKTRGIVNNSPSPNERKTVLKP